MNSRITRTKGELPYVKEKSYNISCSCATSAIIRPFKVFVRSRTRLGDGVGEEWEDASVSMMQHGVENERRLRVHVQIAAQS